MVMTETTATKVREEQVTGLTTENAHRVMMIREKGTDHPPVPFHFRKEHHGMYNYVHLCTGIRKIGMNCIPGISKTGKP